MIKIHALAYYNKGNTLDDLERYEEALHVYEQAQSLQADDVETLMKLGKVLQHLKRYEEATYVYNDVLRLEPGHVEANEKKGRRCWRCIPTFRRGGLGTGMVRIGGTCYVS